MIQTYLNFRPAAWPPHPPQPEDRNRKGPTAYYLPSPLYSLSGTTKDIVLSKYDLSFWFSAGCPSVSFVFWLRFWTCLTAQVALGFQILIFQSVWHQFQVPFVKPEQANHWLSFVKSKIKMETWCILTTFFSHFVICLRFAVCFVFFQNIAVAKKLSQLLWSWRIFRHQDHPNWLVLLLTSYAS